MRTKEKVKTPPPEVDIKYSRTSQIKVMQE